MEIGSNEINFDSFERRENLENEKREEKESTFYFNLRETV